MKSMQSESITLEAVRVLNLEGQAILDCASRLQSGSGAASFEKALSLFVLSLQKRGKIIVTGVGKSGKVGQKIAATLCSTGSLAVYLHPTEALHGDLGVVSEFDSILALSQTGNTDELLKLILSLKRLKVPVVGLGGNAESQLGRMCDAWIDCSIQQEACPHNLAPTTSTTLALALGDAIAVSLMKLRNFDAAGFAKNHPGGSLGRRLTMTVAEVMVKGDEVAVLKSDATMQDVAIISTEKRLGGVIIADGRKLLGFVTEGDLRRALKHAEGFFQLKASEVMTQNPVTIRPDQMAWEALELMQNHKPGQLRELPVLDESQHWHGLVRLHDLVRLL